MIATIAAVAVIIALAVAGFYFAPKGMRTIVSNAAVAVPLAVGGLLDLLTSFDFGSVMSASSATWAVLAVNGLNVIWRALTTTPIGQLE